MKPSDLSAYLLMIAGLGIVFVLAVNAIWPPEPHPLVVDAAMPSQPVGPLVLILPPEVGKVPWCHPPANRRRKDYIERT